MPASPAQAPLSQAPSDAVDHDVSQTAAVVSAAPAGSVCPAAPTFAFDSTSRASMPIARDRFMSRGHLDDAWTSTIRTLAQPGQHAHALWLAELSRGDQPTELVLGIQQPGPTFHAACFLVASPDGAVLRWGPLADCSGCHAAAPDGIFSSTPQPESSVTTPR